MSRPIVVALHGVGSNARDLAAALTPLQSLCDVVALDGPEPFDGGGAGRQWFSIAAVTEANRPARVAAALPTLLVRFDEFAASRGVARDQLVLLGFSQGAIMILAAVAGGHHKGKAVAIAGRLAAPVVRPVQPAHVLLVHDHDDGVMPADLSVAAASSLRAVGHDVDSIQTAGLGHAVGRPTLVSIERWLANRFNLPADADQLQG
jgi:phospholipase/carboxylesterase